MSDKNKFFFHHYFHSIVLNCQCMCCMRMPGQRKFRLSRRKRCERKRAANCSGTKLVVSVPRLLCNTTSIILPNPPASPCNEEAIESLVVSIPQSVFLNGSVADSNQLFQGLEKLKVLPPLWSVVEDNTLHRSLQFGEVQIMMNRDCLWKLTVDADVIHPPADHGICLCSRNL